MDVGVVVCRGDTDIESSLGLHVRKNGLGNRTRSQAAFKAKMRGIISIYAGYSGKVLAAVAQDLRVLRPRIEHVFWNL